MAGPNTAVSSVDGSLDWSGGVDSLKVPTIQSGQNPNGLARNELAWLNNATVRDGGISPRGGWKNLLTVTSGLGRYQGGFMYQPPSGDPYIVCSIGGHIFKVADGESAVDLSLTAFSQGGALPNFVYLQNVDAGPVGSTESSPSTDLGSYTPFTIPAVGNKVKVSTTTNYTGPIGATITLGFSSLHKFHITFNTDLVANAPGATYTLVPPFVTGVLPSLYGSHTIEVTTTSPYPYSVGQSVPVYLYRDSTFIYGTLPISAIVDLGAVGQGHFIVVSASSQFPQTNPAFERQSYFCQAEQFLIIQAGDYVTLPMFWDGSTLRRSVGITNTAVAPGTPGVNEIPPAGPMDYFAGRLWYAQGRNYSAGDIVKGGSGTAAYGFLDSVLNVTENPMVLGGDGFSVPSQAGNITALAHNANLDTALGQGSLFIFTRKAIYSLNPPVTRTAWIAATNANQPLQTVVQLSNGTTSDRSVTAVNGDLYFQSLEPQVRSLITAIRYFNQAGNKPFAANEQRIFNFVDKTLLNVVSGIYFDNRVLMTSLPINSPQGIVHSAVIPLDFTPLSTFETDTQPCWEGMYEGIDILQMFTGDFSGEDRAFALVVSRKDQSIQLWEITPTDRYDGDNRITWQIEFPAFTWGQEFAMKKLIGAELWVDKLWGEVVFKMEYRPDGDPCWHKWHEWKKCSPRNSCETVENPVCYPITQLGDSYAIPMTLPTPPEDCVAQALRPAYIGYQFQPRLTITGYCRLRGMLLHASPYDRKLYDKITC